jgi:glycine oxidase
MPLTPHCRLGSAVFLRVFPPARDAARFPKGVLVNASKRKRNSEDPVIIVGGGVIGLSIGWQLARCGVDVTIFDRNLSGRGASWVAAGMLAPHSEVGFEEEDFLRLGRESLAQYAGFLDELALDSGRKVPLDERGTLFVGFHRDDSERMKRLFRFRQGLGLPVEWLDGTEARDIEPLLSPKVTSAMWLPEDSQIDNRALLEALKAAFVGRGGRLEEETPVEMVSVKGDRITGVRTGSEERAASSAIIAAGCWSNRIGGIPAALLPPVRPVKGQLVALRMDDGFEFSCVIRAPDVYLLPKADGRLLLGATEEEMGFDETPTAGPVMRLLERGWEAIPSIYDLTLDGTEVGLRPGSRDHQPIVGPTPIKGLYYATGHHRHGILLAPATAYAMRDLVLEGKTHPAFRPFQPARFLKMEPS